MARRPRAAVGDAIGKARAIAVDDEHQLFVAVNGAQVGAQLLERVGQVLPVHERVTEQIEHARVGVLGQVQAEGLVAGTARSLFVQSVELSQGNGGLGAVRRMQTHGLRHLARGIARERRFHGIDDELRADPGDGRRARAFDEDDGIGRHDP